MLKIVIFSTLIILIMGLSSNIYHEDNTINPYNLSNEMFNGLQNNITDNFYELIEQNNNHTYQDYDNKEFSIHRLMNIIYYYIIAIVNILGELMKWAFTFGFENPQFDYIWFTKWIIYVSLIIIFFSIIPIIPYLIAIFYLLYKGIQYIIKKVRNFKKR